MPMAHLATGQCNLTHPGMLALLWMLLQVPSVMLCEGVVKIYNRMPIFILFLLVSALPPFDTDIQYLTEWY